MSDDTTPGLDADERESLRYYESCAAGERDPYGRERAVVIVDLFGKLAEAREERDALDKVGQDTLRAWSDDLTEHEIKRDALQDELTEAQELIVKLNGDQLCL